jgi:hypothetical protein
VWNSIHPSSRFDATAVQGTGATAGARGAAACSVGENVSAEAIGVERRLDKAGGKHKNAPRPIKLNRLNRASLFVLIRK